MVDLQNLKNAISGGQFSEEAKALMLPIVDAAIARGSMTAGEKKKLQDIMDVEIDGSALEQGAHEEAAEMIESFLAESDSAAQTASDNLDALDKETDSEIESMKNQPTNLQPETPVSQATVQTETPPLQPPTQ